VTYENRRHFVSYEDACLVMVNHESFEMMMMFSPPGGGVPVPLRKVDWWWKGTARNWDTGGWSLLTNNIVTNQSDADALQYPQWQSWATNSHWQFTNELPQCNHITYICCLF